MIAAQIIDQQIAQRKAAYEQYAAGLEKLKQEFVILKGLADGELAEINRLKLQLQSLGNLQTPAVIPALHPLETAAGVGRAPPPEPGQQFIVLPGELLPVPPARQGPMHQRQDPWGTPAMSYDGLSGVPRGDMIPRGAIKDITPPSIVNDQTYVDPDTKQPTQGI